jgi:hypothetical protein
VDLRLSTRPRGKRRLGSNTAYRPFGAGPRLSSGSEYGPNRIHDIELIVDDEDHLPFIEFVQGCDMPKPIRSPISSGLSLGS